MGSISILQFFRTLLTWGSVRRRWETPMSRQILEFFISQFSQCAVYSVWQRGKSSTSGNISNPRNWLNKMCQVILPTKLEKNKCNKMLLYREIFGLRHVSYLSETNFFLFLCFFVNVWLGWVYLNSVRIQDIISVCQFVVNDRPTNQPHKTIPSLHPQKVFFLFIIWTIFNKSFSTQLAFDLSG